MEATEGPARGLSYTSIAKWYVLRVHARREKWIANALRTIGNTVCLPLHGSLRQWSDRRTRIDVPVFPGYVFCQFNSATGAQIFQVPGVLSILGSGGRATPIEPEEVQALQVLERAKVSADPWPCLKAGDWVVIESGALDGLIGILQDSRKSARVVVSVSLLNRAVAVEVDRASVRPISPPKYASPCSLTAVAGRPSDCSVLRQPGTII